MRRSRNFFPLFRPLLGLLFISFALRLHDLGAWELGFDEKPVCSPATPYHRG